MEKDRGSFRMSMDQKKKSAEAKDILIMENYKITKSTSHVNMDHKKKSVEAKDIWPKYL